MSWSFSEWNSFFLDHFFNSANAGKPVRLAVDADFLEREGADGGGVDGFLTAVNVGPEWLTPQECGHRDLKSRWHVAARYWPHMGDNTPKPDAYLKLHPRINPPNLWRRTPPPFLPYVCLCAYAWTLEPDLHATNFFKRLELVYPNHGLRTLNWTKSYWDNLRMWSCDPAHMNGERGLFWATNVVGGNAFTGLALSQVLLRAKHIERLPEVFDVAGLPPNRDISPDELGIYLTSAGGSLVPLLGKSLTHVLGGMGDPIRAALLEVIHDVYKEWDGEVDRRRVQSRRAVAGLQDADVAYSRIPLRLVLVPRVSATGRTSFEPRITLSPDYWGGRQFFITDDQTEAEWVATPSALDSSCLCFARQVNSGTQFLSGTRILDGCPIIAGHEGDERAIEFRYQCKDLRFLQWEQVGSKQLLLEVESRACRTNDYLYVLVRTDSDGWERFRRWKSANPDAVQVVEADVDDARNWRTYVINLANAPQVTSIPLIDEIWPTAPTARLFTLVGGERVRGRKYGVHQFFVDDLPLISTLPGVTLQVVGAEVVALLPESETDSLQGRDNCTTLYELSPLTDSDRVEIRATRDHRETYSREIKIYRGQVDADLPENDFALDELGRRASRTAATADSARFQGIALFGPEVANICEMHNGYRSHPDDEQTIALRENRDRLGLELFDTLRNAAANTGRLRYAEFRRHVSRLYLGATSTYVAEALRDAAIIDIETDHRGRWTHVHPRGPSLCRLPTLNNGHTEFLLTGCYTRVELSRLKDAATRLGIAIEQHFPWGYGGRRVPAMPSRRTVPCSENTVDDWVRAARSHEWSIPHGVPAEYIITHAADISLWRTRHLDPEWHSYAGIESEEQEFPPDDAALPNVSFRLESATDAITESNRCYQLVDLRNAVRRYARVTEPEWAKWFAWTVRQAPNANLPIPQPGVPGENNADMELVLPRCLPLPPLFARAMVLCTGYPAVYTSRPGNRWLRDSQFARLPEGVIAYAGIPARLSDMMFRKLGYS